MKGILSKVKSAGRTVADKFLKAFAFAAAVLLMASASFATDPTITPPVNVAGYATSLGTSLGTVITAAIGVGLGIFVVFMGIMFLKRLAKS